MKFSIQEIIEDFKYWKEGKFSTKAEIEFSNLFKEALENNNLTQLSEYFKLWDDREGRFSFDKLTRNYVAYHKGLEFGFETISFDTYGWLECPKWLDVEEIEFKCKGTYLVNKITVGKGKNNLWVYGLYWGFAFGGGAFGLNVFNESFDSYEIVVEVALRDMLKRLTKENGNNNSKELREIIKQIEYKLTELTKIDRNNQLSFF